MRLLVADDDEVVARSLAAALEREGHAVDVVLNGTDAVWLAQEEPFDALIVDVSLPGYDGFTVARKLRTAEVWTPILLLTGRGELEHRIEGLDAGADDYVVKPAAVGEVIARLRAITRRAHGPRPVVLSAGDITVDPTSRRAWRGGIELDLTPKEYALLELLVRQPGVTFSRGSVEKKLWDFAFAGTSNVVESLVRRLRAKVDRPGLPACIETVRGRGYRLAVD